MDKQLIRSLFIFVAFVSANAQMAVLPGVFDAQKAATGGGSLSSVQTITGCGQHGGTCSYSGNTLVAPFASNLGAGHNVAGCVVWWSNLSGLYITVSDTQSLTYAPQSTTLVNTTATDYSYIGGECFTSSSTSAAADTVSIVLTNGSSTEYVMEAWIWEVSGGAIFQAGSTGTFTTATSLTAGSITPSQTGSFTIGAVVSDITGGPSPFTAGGSFTLLSQYGGGNSSVGAEYYAQSATTSAVTAPFTVTGNTPKESAVIQMVLIP